jgi:uncharacterized protein YndB with AHSA1/START domain
MTSLTHEFSATLPAPRERVFRAFTDEAELQCWFAQHVEVNPLAGGEYRFWGMHTQGAPMRAQATQKIVRIEPPSLLAFSWRLEDADSEVTLQLDEEVVPDATAAGVPADAHATGGSPDAQATGRSAEAKAAVRVTALKGRHHFPHAPQVPRPLDLVDDIWRIALANLNAHLAGGSGVCLPDFSDPLPRLRQTILINAPRERVFQALLDPAVLDPWLGAQSVVEPRVEGRYSYGWKYDVRGKQVAGGPTKILELVEDTRLVTDWPNWRGDPDMPVQRITWLLEPVGDGTRVILIHEPFERTADLSDYPQGWAYFLSGLKSRLEAV